MCTVAAVLLGLVVGGAINLVVHRLPRQLPLFRRPRCTRCGHGLGWEALPVLGYLVQRGRCRHCGQPLVLQFLLSELLTAGTFGLLYWRHGLTLLGGCYALFAVAMVLTLFIDWLHHDIYYLVIVPAAGLGLLAHLLPVDQRLDFRSSVLGALVGMVFFGLLSGFGWFLFHSEVLSLGDVWLAGTIGAMAGLYGALLALALGIVLAAVGAGLLLLLRRVSSHDYIPYGSYLCLATLIYLCVWAP